MEWWLSWQEMKATKESIYEMGLKCGFSSIEWKVNSNFEIVLRTDKERITTYSDLKQLSGTLRSVAILTKLKKGGFKL